MQFDIYGFSWMNVGVVKLKNIIHLVTVIIPIDTNFDSPGSFNLRDLGVHTDRQGYIDHSVFKRNLYLFIYFTAYLLQNLSITKHVSHEAVRILRVYVAECGCSPIIIEYSFRYNNKTHLYQL